MKNKNVGMLIIGISIVIGIIVYIFNIGLKKIVGETCTHGPTCSMFDTISIQTNVSLGIAALIFIIGLYIFFAKEEVKVEVKKVEIKDKKKKLDLKGLDKDERKVINLLQEENGAVFQRTLMEKLEIGKVKATRLLDKLEAKQLIERKRRGMNNIVVLK